jgi:hypothetical protein
MRSRLSDMPTDRIIVALRPRHELDAMAANVELTLMSIIQGVALYFVTDSSRVVISGLDWRYLPYVVCSVLIVVTVWSRSILHAITVVRWPLEFGRNAMYVVVTVVEALLFTQIPTPARWYPMSLVMAVVFLMMFALEQRMYRLRRRDSGGPAGLALLDLLETEHRTNLRVLMPLFCGSWLLLAGLVLAWPEVFITRDWHVALGAIQALSILGYFLTVLRFYARITDLILAARTEWGES